MAKTLVIYSSKYGSTRQYAEWIAEAVSADIMPVEKADAKRLSEYGTVVFGACVYIGKMKGIDFIIRNWGALEGKKVVVFSVSASLASSQNADDIYQKNLPGPLREKVKYFHLSGRIGKLDMVDAALMMVPRSAARAKYEKTKSDDAKNELERLERFDEVDKNAIGPIVDEINR